MIDFTSMSTSYCCVQLAAKFSSVRGSMGEDVNTMHMKYVMQ